MKKKATLIALLFLGLIACDKDDPAPIKVEDVQGDYTGKVITTQGTKKVETSTGATAKNNVLTFSELPVRQLVLSVLKDSVKTDAAMKTIRKVKYELNYTPKVNAGNTAVDLTFAPKALEVTVPVEGANKKVVVTFEAKSAGSYKNKVLKADMEAVKITVDGTQVTPFDKIVYSIPSFTKK